MLKDQTIFCHVKAGNSSKTSEMQCQTIQGVNKILWIVSNQVVRVYEVELNHPKLKMSLLMLLLFIGKRIRTADDTIR